MIVAESLFLEMINNVSREFTGRVELLEGSTLLQIFTYDGALQSFTIERVGDTNKIFGYGICQKLTVKLRDKGRAINITKGQRLDVSFGVGADYLYTTPVFFVDEIKRDENTNALTITAYDAIYQAANYTVSDLNMPLPYSIYSFVLMAAAKLGMPFKLDGAMGSVFNTSYPQGANFSGSETLREALDDIAEATGTIYFMDKDWNLVFKKLDISGNPVLVIDKSKYFTFTEKTPYTLRKITHATELGDNVTVDSGIEGVHQYIRENAFLANRDDIHTLMEGLLANVNGLTMIQFDLKWRGHFGLEIGDRIAIQTKNNRLVYGYVLNDTITYNGGLVETTSYSYENKDSETDSNPATLGEALKNTFAKVDKVNNEITLLASETQKGLEEQREYTDEKAAEIKVTTDSITQSVSNLRTYTNNAISKKAAEIKVTTDAITQSVTDLKEYTDGAIEEKAAEIKVTTDAISQRVTQTNTSVDNVKTELESSIEQTASSIRSEITAQGETITSIQQDLDGISLTYNSANGTASITIGDVTVSNLVDGNYVDEAVAGVTITGYVTFNDLKNTGSTVINGSNITTGTISADRIDMTGAIAWGDLSSSCRNTIASYAGAPGADGSDAEVPDYIHSTYIDATTIYSPKIYGAELYAGTATDGYIKMTSNGMNFVSKTNGNLIGFGYYASYYDFPYIVLGQGVDSNLTDQGLIKKYENGIWIGDSDSIHSSSPSAYSIGIFIDFTNGKLYRYNGSGTRAELV